MLLSSSLSMLIFFKKSSNTFWLIPMSHTFLHFHYQHGSGSEWLQGGSLEHFTEASHTWAPSLAVDTHWKCIDPSLWECSLKALKAISRSVSW